MTKSELSDTIAELAAVRTMDELVDTIVTRCAAAVGAHVASLSVLDAESDMLQLVALRGGMPNADKRWASYPATSATPAAEALQTGHAVIVVGREDIQRQYPTIAADIVGDGTLLCLPLIASGEKLGVISLSTPQPWRPDPLSVDFLSIFGNTCAQALARILASARADAAVARLAFLASASVELAKSLDYKATLAVVAQLAVPTIADWCAVDIAEDGALRLLAVDQVDDSKSALVHDYLRRLPHEFDATVGAPSVIRSGESQLHRRIDETTPLLDINDDDQLALTRELSPRSAMIVPLPSRGRIIGTLTLVSAESLRTFGSGDVDFAQHLGRRAATAIDNASLHTETREAALNLQRAVLPERIVETDSWDLAAYYSPSGQTDVGGDFYDIVPLADGRLVLVVGDVMGRGVAAAAAMARMRAAVEAYIAVDPDPVFVVEKLDRMFETFSLTGLVSMVYMLVHPDGARVTVVNAGHCPPALIYADGSVELLESTPQPPLGVRVDSRSCYAWDIPEGGAILAYTDGLVERRREDIDVGIGRVINKAGRLASGPLEAGLETLVAESQRPEDDDDVTAVAARRKA